MTEKVPTVENIVSLNAFASEGSDSTTNLAHCSIKHNSANSDTRFVSIEYRVA